jgi:hypothetical protein
VLLDEIDDPMSLHIGPRSEQVETGFHWFLKHRV